MEEGISLFSTLLNNRHFLIVFVHALEQQKDFAVRDRYELQNQRPGSRRRLIYSSPVNNPARAWSPAFQLEVELYLPPTFLLEMDGHKPRSS